MAQQASNIEDLMEVIRASLKIMCKQWSDAMHTFHEKFDPLSTLIVNNGNFWLQIHCSYDISLSFFSSSCIFLY